MKNAYVPRNLDSENFFLSRWFGFPIPARTAARFDPLCRFRNLLDPIPFPPSKSAPG
jgi:hypothetical protein